jgi:hypothetical protein
MADESYWGWRACSPTPAYIQVPPWVFAGTEQDWHALSPGMRREIVRAARKRGNDHVSVG